MSDDDFYLDGDEAEAGITAKELGSALSQVAKITYPLYFDLETVPDYSRLDTFGLEPVPPVPATTPISDLPSPASVIEGTADDVKKRLLEAGIPDPSWLEAVATAERLAKDRKGVQDLIKQAGQRRQEAIDACANRTKLLSTTPEYCSICAIGVAVGNEAVKSFVVGEKVTALDGSEALVTEELIIHSFWSAAKRCAPLIGFNIIGFDLPVLLVRSAILGIEPTKIIDLSPWGRDVLDIYLRRFPRGKTADRPGKLKELAPLFGIDVPAGDCDGSQVDGLMKTPEGRVKCGAYVRSDVEVLRELHKKLAGYFWM